MLHQAYSNRSESLSDAEWGLVNRINNQAVNKAPQIYLICQIGVQNGDHKFLRKMYKQLTPRYRQSLRRQFIMTYTKSCSKDQSIIDEFKQNKFYSLTCEQQFFIIKICYTKNQQQKRYINEVIDMFEQQATKQSAKRIYKNLPYWCGKKFFDIQMKRRLQNKGGQKLYLRYKKQLSEMTCKECLQQLMTWFKKTIKKKE